jgi:hypothetical protein
MKPEVYRRMKVAGRLLVLIGLSVPAVLILLLFLRLGELVVLAARECAVLAVGFIVIGAVLWAGGWILEGNTSLGRQMGQELDPELQSSQSWMTGNGAVV